MIRINLLPVRAEKKKESLRQQGMIAVGVVILVGAVIAGVHLAIRADVRERQEQITERNAKIAALKVKIGEVKEYKQKKRDLEEKIDVIAGLEAKQKGPAKVLFELAQLTPEKIWIESFKDNGGSMSLDGVAIDNQTIAQFMTKLEMSSWFKAVRLDVTKQVTRGGATLKAFTIKANVVYAKAG